MCGIAGAFFLDGRDGLPLAPEVLKRMTDVIEHRGPDDAGHVLEDSVALGARRLSIIDVAGGHQPFANEDGRVWGAQNGELYCHERVRGDLQRRGHTFRSRCDTEILPHLFEEYGPGLCEHLHGKFALAVWDGRRRQGLLARDRLGIKPLYYAEVDGRLVFGSELKCVIASGLVSDELDLEALAAYLVLGFVPGPRTPLRDVHKVMPGERLVIGGGKVRAERYWQHPVPEPECGVSDEEWVERLRETLGGAVRRRLMSDVPLGAMLSGGLDSSVIVAMMAQELDAPVQTFAIGFEGDSDSELGDARSVAAALGADHHELELPMATGPDAVDRLVWQLDEPVRSLSAAGFEALSGLARRRVTVALSGQGADELFGGYRKHRVASLAGSWQRAPRGLRAPLAAALQRGPGAAGRLAESLQAADPISRLLASSGLVRPELEHELFDGALAEHADAARRAAERYAGPVAGASPLAALLHLDAQLGLVDDMIHYFDRASMSHSLEVRVPFLDHEVVELAARMPDRMKVRGRDTKHVLRRMARDLVPDAVLAKPKQGFFKDAVGPWLAADGGAVVEHFLLAPEPRYAALVDPGTIRRVVGEWRAGQTGHAQFLLGMVMLESWLSAYLPRAFAGVGDDRLAAA